MRCCIITNEPFLLAWCYDQIAFPTVPPFKNPYIPYPWNNKVDSSCCSSLQRPLCHTHVPLNPDLHDLCSLCPLKFLANSLQGEKKLLGTQSCWGKISFLQWSDTEYISHTPEQASYLGVAGQSKTNSMFFGVRAWARQRVCVCLKRVRKNIKLAGRTWDRGTNYQNIWFLN